MAANHGLAGGVHLAVTPFGGGSKIRASTLFFDQAVARFLSTLPLLERVG